MRPYTALNVPNAFPRLFIETSCAMPERSEASCTPSPSPQQPTAIAAAVAPPRNPSGSASIETRMPHASTTMPYLSNSLPKISAVSPFTPIASA